ncbi:MAG: DUF3159 domain-containing protein [Acidimicrobiia bacterium]|nr:DUF3159 domain-containing protein [Acidimicrobiia bacterium]
MNDKPLPQSPLSAAPTRADMFDQYMPIVLFLLFNNFVGLLWAIVAMTLWAIKAQVSRYRRGLPLGRVMPVVVAYLMVRGVIGIIYDSEEVYFGIGIGVKALAAVGLLVSAGLRRNAVGYVLPYLVHLDTATVRHPVYRSATKRISVAVALVVFASVGFDTWLLQNASTNEFVAIRLGVNWGLSVLTLVAVGIYLDRRLRRIPNFPGLMRLLERRLDGLSA